MDQSKRKIDAHTERVVAVRACVDPRTVRRYMAGKSMRSTTAAVVRAALIELGRPDLLPDNDRRTYEATRK